MNPQAITSNYKQLQAITSNYRKIVFPLLLAIFTLLNVNVYAYPTKDCVMATPTHHISTPTTASALGLSGTLTGVSFFIEADFTIDVASQYRAISRRGAENETESAFIDYVTQHTHIAALADKAAQIRQACAISGELWQESEALLNACDAIDAQIRSLIKPFGSDYTQEEQAVLSGLVENKSAAAVQRIALFNTYASNVRASLTPLVSLTVDSDNQTEQAFDQYLTLSIHHRLKGATEAIEQAAALLAALGEDVYGPATKRAWSMVSDSLFSELLIARALDCVHHETDHVKPDVTTANSIDWTVIQSAEKTYYISYNGTEQTTYQIYGANGQVVRQGSLTAPGQSVDMHGCTQGMYFVQIKGDAVAKKMIIK